MLEKKILLSIITCGKNDEYAGNFVQRLQFNLDRLGLSISDLKIDDVEIILVDWGSTTPLKDVLNTSNFHNTKIIHVKKEIADKKSPDSKFSFTQSLNCGYRKSTGEFIFFIDGDSYIPKETFINLYNLVKNSKDKTDVFYWASRYHLPYHIHSNCKSVSELDGFIDEWIKTKSGWRHDRICLNNFSGTAMGILLSKLICEETSCWFEKLNKWGWVDIEFHKRISQKYPCKGDLENNNMVFFHLDHHNLRVMGLNGTNPLTNGPNFKANDENWGLIDENLEFYEYRK